MLFFLFFFFFKQKTAYEMRISDWSSDVCSSDLMYGAYIRTDSYFDNSELGSRGLPTGAELALLEPFRDRLPPELFTEEFSVPTTAGSGNPRLNLRTALRILREAGWSVRDGVLRTADGLALNFDIMIGQPGTERLAPPFFQTPPNPGIPSR